MELRPNKLKDKFIDDVRNALNSGNFAENKIADIEAAYKKFDQDLQKQSSDDYLLW